MDTLRVRVYNIRFGDAILVSVPERTSAGTETKHLLIDVGNVLSGGGGDDAVFEPVLEDVRAVLAGRPLDLYVMTHEHMDHVQGLFYASTRLGMDLDGVRFAWLTASAAEDYYDRHPQAREKKLEAAAVYGAIERYLEAEPDASVERLMLNNNPRSTGECVQYLRGLAEETAYVYRGCDLAGSHPFEEATVEILAPEEDTSAYYGPFQPLSLDVAEAGDAAPVAPQLPEPPAGVDTGAFYGLVEARRRGLHDNLLAIDRAANNSSVVFVLEWRGWRLLFPGDAEHRSWKTMAAKDVLRPVHFLKVSHHGSWNGTPRGEILDAILPPVSPDGRRRFAAVSTCPDTYHGVPDEETLAELAARTEVRSVLSGVADGGYLDVEFEG